MIVRASLATVVAFAAATAAQAAITIGKKPTQNVACSAGICSATAAKATLNATDLANMLAASDVTVAPGALAQDIDVTASFSWVSAHRLTLDAYRSIGIEKPVDVAGTAGFTLTFGDGGSDGTLAFTNRGSVQFRDVNSSLVIQGTSYGLVKTVKQLAAQIAQDPGGHFALSGNYNAGKDGTYTKPPIPTDFTGTFEGLGNTISNLTIHSSSSSDIGLFADVDTGGVLRDISLAAADIQSNGSSAAVGALMGAGTGVLVAGAHVDATVSAPHSFESGILAAEIFNGEVDYSSSSGAITGNNGVGGLVADNFNSTIRWSSSSATVSSPFADVGGLVGTNYSSQGPIYGIDHCFATGAVSVPSATYIGGLVGYSANAFLSNSYATGTVTGGDGANAGGLIGHAEGSIATSYAIGSVTGGQNAWVGGLAGYKLVTTTAVYSTGAVSAGAGSKIGGSIGLDATLNGYNNAYIYWDTDTSGVSDLSQGVGNVSSDSGVTGLTTSQLQSQLPSGFDRHVWAQKQTVNGGLPYLRDLPPR